MVESPQEMIDSITLISSLLETLKNYLNLSYALVAGTMEKYIRLIVISTLARNSLLRQSIKPL